MDVFAVGCISFSFCDSELPGTSERRHVHHRLLTAYDRLGAQHPDSGEHQPQSGHQERTNGPAGGRRETRWSR